MEAEFAYDVFLSHNNADKPRVRRLAKRLKKAGLRVWFDEWVIQAGDQILLAVEHGLKASRSLLLCLSPNALGSEWVTMERTTVLFRDPTNRNRRFIPVLLADCEIPDTLRGYKYVDYRSGSHAAFVRLLTACRPQGQGKPPGKGAPASKSVGQRKEKSTRGDFSEKTKETLAKRVGMRCSNPDCRKPTSGPRDDPDKALNIGVAAHVTAASPGGPRYDASLSVSVRCSIKNAIWLCQNCAKLADSDEKRYTAALLRSWKNVAEQAALRDIAANAQQEALCQTVSRSGAKQPQPKSFRHTPLARELKTEFPTLLASVVEQAFKYASARAKKGNESGGAFEDYPAFGVLRDRLFDLHLLYLVQRQVPAMTDRERRALLALTVKLIQQQAPSFIRHRAFLLASDLVLSVAGFPWRDHCERLRPWLDGKPEASLSLGDHWLLCSLMLSGTDDEARKGSKLGELRRSPQFGTANREHAALNIAEGLRGILVAASRTGKMAAIAEDRILAASRWIDLGYVEEPKSSGASQIRLLLLCADLANVAKVCRTCHSHRTVTQNMYRLATQAIGKIDRPRIKEVAQRIVQLGDNPAVAAWDLEPTYMHSDDFWEQTDDHELKEVLLELFEVAHTGRDKADYCGPGWQSWRDYYAYLGSTSANPRIRKIACAALREAPPAMSGFTRPSGDTARYVEPKERIHFASKVEAMEQSADRQRDLDMFVTSAKGETKTRRFQRWAGGARVTLAIVFTDVVGSTALGEEIRDEAMNEVRRAHFVQSRRLIGQFQGREIKTIGDSFMAAFRSADLALDYARALQGDTGHPQVRIRAGIHIGPMHVEEGDVFGGTVNFAARVVGAIQGAEIWLSERAKEDIDRLGAKQHRGLKWERHEGVAMKGFPGKFTLWALK